MIIKNLDIIKKLKNYKKKENLVRNYYNKKC